MNVLKLILYNTAPILLILGSIFLHYNKSGWWGAYLACGVFLFLITIANSKKDTNE